MIEPRRILRLFAVALALAAAPRIAPASEPAASDDSIAAAKRQLDALRAEANTSKAGTAAGTVPRVTVPQLHMGTNEETAAAGTSPLTEEAKRRQRLEKKSANWLVDAVMKEERAAKANRARERGEQPGEDDEESLFFDEEREEKNPLDVDGTRDGSDGARKESAPAPTETVVNPLARYMSDWLSSQDYDLLRPTIETPRLGDTASGAQMGGAPTSPTNDLASAIAAFGSDAEKKGAADSALAKPSENPYLQGLALPDPVVLSTPPPASMPLPAPAPAPPTFEAPAPVTKPAVPDFAKPAVDDKYFKPLKRF